MNNVVKPGDRIGLKISSSASLFKKVLQAFGNGDLPYADLQSDLQRMLTSGASPEELREVLHRYASIEPLPAYAHMEVLQVLDEAMAAAALKVDPDPAQSQPQDTQATPPSAPAPAADTRPGEKAPEPSAEAVQARATPSATVAAVAAIPRPVTAVRSGEAAATPAEIVSSIEARIARQRADYKALNHAYERVRDAGSAASARTIALTAELAAVRTALESEQAKTRTLDQALSESIASGEAAQARSDEARRESEQSRQEQRSVRDLLAARDATIDQLHGSLAERENQLAALGAELAQARTAVESAQNKIRDADQAALRELGERDAQIAALRREHAQIKAAQELEHAKSRETRKALAERVAAEEAARAHGEDALRELEEYRAELGKARELLAALQRDHVTRVPALDTGASVRTQLDDDLRREVGERDAQLAALQREHAQLKAALELEHARSEEARKALAERIAAEEATRSNGEDALRRLQGYRVELSKARDLLAARDREHTKIVAAFGARTKELEAQLQDAETLVPADKWASAANYEITVALDPPRERAREPEPVPAFERFSAREAAPIAAPESKRAAPLPGPLPGSRARWTAAAVARIAGVSAVLAVLAVVVWILMRHAPVAVNIPVVAPAAVAKPGTVIRDCPACPALTVVPTGRFKQGSDRADGNSPSSEKPPHWVLIGRPFAISTNAVTVDEFRAFAAASGRDMRGCETYEDKWRFRPEASWESPGFTQTGSHPVTCVSWSDAKAYAGWLSKTTGHRYRLPSAAEWEYAARAGGEAVRPWAADGPSACASANVADQRAARRYPGWTIFPCDDGYVYTAPVGSFKANSFGLNDMLGNVFQWADDCWHVDYTGVPADGGPRTYGDCTERELRGGSWFTTPDLVRASYRNHFGVNFRASSVGIRLVRDLAS